MGGQIPYIQLPGLEYFAQAPNRSVAIGPWRSAVDIGSPVSVPSDGVGTLFVNQQLESNFIAHTGIQLRDFNIVYFPVDESGSLEIKSVYAQLALSSAGGGGPSLGLPLATTLSPTNLQVILTERDKLWSFAEIMAMNGISDGGLFVRALVSVGNNDPTLAHSANIQTQFRWVRLDGMLQ